MNFYVKYLHNPKTSFIIQIIWAFLCIIILYKLGVFDSQYLGPAKANKKPIEFLKHSVHNDSPEYFLL